MRISRAILEEALELAVEDENAGICLACGEVRYGVEPDALRLNCEVCGERQVYGAEEIINMGRK